MRYFARRVRRNNFQFLPVSRERTTSRISRENGTKIRWFYCRSSTKRNGARLVWNLVIYDDVKGDRRLGLRTATFVDAS